MRKTFLIIIAVLILLFGASCSGIDTVVNDDNAATNTVPSDYIYGKWVCCGVVDEGDELTESNIIGSQEMEKMFGADITGSEMVIGENGIEGYSEISGNECGSLEQISTTEYRWELKINKLDGEDLDEPITEIWHFMLNDGYLFVTLEYDTDEYDPGKPIVYKRAQ